MCELTASLVLHPDRPAGGIRPLHGVNNGPVSLMGTPSTVEAYRALDVPMARIHDAVMTQPWVVDTSCLFPLFHTDPDDPRNYVFAPTDQYLRGLADLGCAIVFRLGTSIDHAPDKIFSHPPIDDERWARVCVNIVRHYNEGWGDGLRLGIRHWEIWNEPDLGPTTWTGSLTDYCRLYECVARAIKAHDPDLRVGGPSLSDGCGSWAQAFLAHCRDRAVPLDFYSWHVYHQRPDAIADLARTVRDLLDRHGFQATESQLNEWHCFDGDWQRIRTDSTYTREVFHRINGPVGAAFAAATLIALQDAPVDMASYYTGDCHRWGLFDRYGCPLSTYYAFLAFRRLLDTPQRIAVTTHAANVWVAAGLDEQGAGQALIAHCGSEPCTIRCDWTLPVASRGLQLIDDTPALRAVPLPEESDTGHVRLTLPGHAVALLGWTGGG